MEHENPYDFVSLSKISRFTHSVDKVQQVLLTTDTPYLEGFDFLFYCSERPKYETVDNCTSMTFSVLGRSRKFDTIIFDGQNKDDTCGGD